MYTNQLTTDTRQTPRTNTTIDLGVTEMVAKGLNFHGKYPQLPSLNPNCPATNINFQIDSGVGRRSNRGKRRNPNMADTAKLVFGDYYSGDGAY
jgi:hypothetical protein